jgi:ribosomal protein L12E/L44/L45/RPP1/RPP2
VDHIDSYYSDDLAPEHEVVSGFAAVCIASKADNESIASDVGDICAALSDMCNAVSSVFSTALTGPKEATGRSLANTMAVAVKQFLRVVGGYDINELSQSCQSLVQATVARVRGLATQLLRAHPLQNAISVKCGLVLLEALCDCSTSSVSFGLGNGLWVSLAVLPHLERVVVFFRKTSRLAMSGNERAEYLLLMCRALAGLVTSVDSRRICRVLAADVISLALREVNTKPSASLSAAAACSDSSSVVEETVNIDDNKSKMHLSLVHAVLRCLDSMWQYRTYLGGRQWDRSLDVGADDVHSAYADPNPWESAALELCKHVVFHYPNSPLVSENGSSVNDSSGRGMFCFKIIHDCALPVAPYMTQSSPGAEATMNALQWTSRQSSDLSAQLRAMAVSALDEALRLRRRERAVTLLRAAGFNEDMEQALWMCMECAHAHISVRMLCMKVLDVLATDVSVAQAYVTASSSASATASETAHHCAEDTKRGDTKRGDSAEHEEEEEEEDDRGRELLSVIVGRAELERFEQSARELFATSQQRHLSYGASDWCRCSCGVLEESNLVAIDSHVDCSLLCTADTALCISPPTELSHSHALSHSDGLGVILRWLVILQRVDTFCTLSSVSSTASQWGARAVIGGYLHHSQMLDTMFKGLVKAQQHHAFTPLPVAAGASTSAGGSGPNDANASPILPSSSASFILQAAATVGRCGSGVVAGGHGNLKKTSSEVHSDSDSDDEEDVQTSFALSSLLAYTLHRSLCLMPILVRKYWADKCTRGESLALEKFVLDGGVNEAIVQREVGIVELAKIRGGGKLPACSSPGSSSGATGLGDEGEMHVSCSCVAREVTATFVADEVTVEMTIRLPSLYPLRNVEVEGRKKLGISEKRWRRWTLQIIQLLSHQDGSVLDAVQLWKRNVDKEFEGVEPCPICYSILHPKTLSMPTLVCKTCNNKFHSACLYKWFHSSGKSKCVLCQQPFF